MKACERISKESSKLEEFDLTQLGEILDRYRNHTGALIPVLQETQKAYGYLSEGILEKIADGLGVPLSQVYGVTTFYSQFKLVPHGQYIIRACHGTACYVSGAKSITESIANKLGIEEGQTTEDRLFTLETVACVGACGLAPVMMINDETFGRLSSQKALKIVRKVKKEGL
jgi:NADH-quinone oxidoreductase subunit E